MKPETLIDAFQPADGPPPRRLMAYIHWCLKGGLGVTAVAGAISALAGTLEVLTALMLGLVIDAALDSTPAQYFDDNVALLAGVTLFFVILRPVILGLSGVAQSVVVGPTLLNLAMIRNFRHSLGQSVTYFDNDFAGRIAQKQGQVSRAVAELMVDLIHTVAFALASVIGSIVLFLTIDPRSAALLTLWVAAYVWMIRFFMPRVRAKSKARAAKRAMVTGQVVDTVTNIKTVKLFAHDDHEDQAAIGAMREMLDASVAYGWTSASFRFWMMGLGGLLPIGLVGLTLFFWSQGTASAGDIAAAGAVSLRLAQMTGWVSFTLMGMYSNVGEIEDGMHTLAPPHTLVDSPGAPALVAGEGVIALDKVTFSYGGGPGGLADVDLTVPTIKKKRLVGASGAGKSTLVSLLLRLYDAEAGTVMVDGQDVSAVTQESLRRQIGMVTQETAMFNRSAFENIRYGQPDATQDEVEAAARQAEAHEFIQSLEDHTGRKGYEAHLGERGVKLSGGQRQRIAIARAILKDAPILVLDEATSALDSEVEASIQAALETIMEGKTVIAIAHRLSTLARMDRIVVLDAGRIVEEGTHEDLLAKGGLYARYWNRQSGGFINVKDAAE